MSHDLPCSVEKSKLDWTKLEIFFYETFGEATLESVSFACGIS